MLGSYESIINHAKEGGDVTQFLTRDNSLAPLAFIVKLESFRLLLMHLSPNKQKNATKIRFFFCINIVGERLGLPDLWEDVKHLVQIRNDMIHDVSSIILNLNDTTTLYKATEELDLVLEKCWKLAREQYGEVKIVRPTEELLTCKLFS